VRSAIGLSGMLLLESCGAVVVLGGGCLLGLLLTLWAACTGRWWQGSRALARPLAATAFRSWRGAAAQAAVEATGEAAAAAASR
jgi:hypothetical protein